MVSTKAISEEQRRQFAALTSRLELTFPSDGEERVFAGYLQLMQMTELVRRSHQGADEPALVFSPASIMRGNESV